MTNIPGVFSQEQQELRSLVRRFLGENSTSLQVRAVMESAEGFDEGLWKQMVELGWMGIAIPEEYGGAGYTFTELGVLLEEMGRTIISAPFFSSAVLGTFSVLNASSEEQRSDLLPKLVDGSARATLAFVEESRWDDEGIQMSASDRGGSGSYTLDGTKMYVLDGHTATHLVVAARLEGDIELFLVDGDADRIVKTPLETLDPTRKQANLTFSATPASLLGQTGTGAYALRKTLQQACGALASEMVGGAQWCLDTATEHAKTRIQFGRPIGSFQGVKHNCADMLVEVEMAKSAAYYASWAASEDEEELAVASSLAKAYCSETFFHAAATTIQVLGGMGFTWEHDAHLYLRRAKSSEIYLGDGDYHRELVFRKAGDVS